MNSNVDLLNINGKKTIYTDNTEVYEILNYDYNKNYNIEAIDGYVLIDDNKIYYTAPSKECVSGFIVNNQKYSIIVHSPYIVKPEIISPLNNSIDIDKNITIISSNFIIVGSNSIHKFTHWVLSKNSNFTNYVINTQDTSNLTKLEIGNLDPNTTYYLKIRYKSEDESLNYSDWSNIINFTTKDSFNKIEIIEDLNCNLNVNTIFTIKNYDRNIKYNVSSNCGYISITDNKIKFTPIIIKNNNWININNNIFIIKIKNYHIDTPTIVFIEIIYKEYKKYISVIGSEFKSIGLNDEIEELELHYSDNVEFNNSKIIISDRIALWNIIYIEDNHLYYIKIRYKGKTIGYSDFSSIQILTKYNLLEIKNDPDIIIPENKINNNDFGGTIYYNSNKKFLFITEKNKDNKGIVNIYNYKKSNTIIQYLIADKPYINDQYGYSIISSIDGNILAISAYNYNYINGYKSGCVYIYKYINDEYILIDTIIPDITYKNSSFGYNLCMSNNGDTLFVSSPDYVRNNVMGLGCVNVYNLVNNRYKRLQTIYPKHNNINSHFGYSISFNDNSNILLIGSYGDNSNIGNSYIYKKLGKMWIEDQILILNKYKNIRYFGFNNKISNDGKLIAISAPQTYDKNENIKTGSVYIFEYINNRWEYTGILKPDNNLVNSFGYTIDISNDNKIIVVGSPHSNNNKGMVYIFIKVDNKWISNNKICINDNKNVLFGYNLKIIENQLYISSINTMLNSNTNIGIINVFK